MINYNINKRRSDWREQFKAVTRPFTEIELRSDNRLSNLELWNTMQPAGQRVEDKVLFAKEILKLYGNN